MKAVPGSVRGLAGGLAGAAILAASVADAGSLVAIGGALDRDNRAIYEKIVALAGDEPLICVFGTASSRAERKAGRAVRDFRRYGAEAVAVDITEANHRRSNRDPRILAQIEGCSGFFFTGGDQSRLTGALLDSPAHAAIRARFDAGAVVAGSSAGAAMMSEIMIGGGDSLDSLVGGYDPVETEPGLGFVGGVVIDQHFLAKGRLGRLLRVTVESGTPLGLGIDENTAVVIPETGPWEVVGESSVVVLEVPEGMEPENTAPEAIEAVDFSLLSNRDRYDPKSRAFIVYAGRENTAEAGPYYGEGMIATSDIFAPGALYDLVTTLVDSPEDRAIGFAFHIGSDGSFSSDGVRLRFEKGRGTAGYWGERTGGAGYTAIRVKLSVEPIEGRVTTD